MSATQTDRFYGVTGGLAIKAPCVTHSTANITALSGLLTVNSVVLAAGDRVLVKDQTAGADNGIYIVATGAWTRAADFDGNRDVVQGTLCSIEGSTSATTWFKVTNAGTITIGTTALTFVLVSAPVATAISVGNLFNPRTNAEEEADIDAYDAANTIGDIMFPQYEPGDVRRYGAVGNDVVNDFAAFQAAFDQNEQSNHDAAEIKSGPHTYYIEGTLRLWNANLYNRAWYAQNTVLRWNADIDGLRVGPAVLDESANSCRIDGYLMVENDQGANGITTDTTGIWFRNMRRGEFHVGAKKWKNGIYCYPIDEGLGYCKFHLGEVHRNNYGVRLKPGGDTGWVNSNSFFGGTFAIIDPQPAGATWPTYTHNWYIYIEETDSTKSSGQPNMNRFHDLDFDMNTAATLQGAYRDEGTYNHLLNPRLELNGTITVKQVLLAAQSRRAFVSPGYDMSQGWRTGNGENSRISDLGTENIVFANDGLHIAQGRGGLATEVIDVKRGHANTGLVPVIAAHDLYDNGGSPQGFLANLNAARAVAGTQSYGLMVTQTGSLVSTGAAADDDLVYWECITTHNPSASADEPGVGVNWRDIWVNCKTDYINGGAAAAWASGVTTYVGRTDVARITGEGHFQFGPITAAKIISGSGVPSSVTAPRGSLYMRTNTTNADQILYVNTDGAEAWSALTT